MAKSYPLENYVTMLKLANRSDATIKSYRKAIRGYARFLKVPDADVHNHLSVDKLLKYAATLTTRSAEGRKTTLNILHRYFVLNGVEFDPLEFNAVKPKVTKEHNDKPLERETLQKMMDLTDVHGKAFLSFLISTGCRAHEACDVLLTDVQGDRVTIRNETAKNKVGGTVFLTTEAKEFLDLWLKERDRHIELSDRRSKGLASIGAIRPKLDNRLFGMSYASAHRMFCRLFDKVDGARGKYHRDCTIHSCRKFFRTHAARGMHPDLVTNIMRQTGYLDSTYVRMNDDDKHELFRKGESSLYITRHADRMTENELKILKIEKQELEQKVAAMEGTIDQVLMFISDLEIGRRKSDAPIRAEILNKVRQAQSPARS